LDDHYVVACRIEQPNRLARGVGEGVDQLREAIAAHRAHAEASGELRRRREVRRREELREIVERRLELRARETCTGAKLVRLHCIAPAGVHHHDGRVGLARNLNFHLTNTDSLDDHYVVACRIEQPNRLARGVGETTEMSARRHRADVDPFVI
ncbi:MAG: hypothetical protein EBX15_05730, partial [Acidimicrobiia bacterium]|nr:hypothetical protein [Acidimicrobiia bacterium]